MAKIDMINNLRKVHDLEQMCQMQIEEDNYLINIKDGVATLICIKKDEDGELVVSIEQTSYEKEVLDKALSKDN